MPYARHQGGAGVFSYKPILAPLIRRIEQWMYISYLPKSVGEERDSEYGLKASDLWIIHSQITGLFQALPAAPQCARTQQVVPMLLNIRCRTFPTTVLLKAWRPHIHPGQKVDSSSYLLLHIIASQSVSHKLVWMVEPGQLTWILVSREDMWVPDSQRHRSKENWLNSTR